jgi:lipopolysaccharide export system protein LptC
MYVDRYSRLVLWLKILLPLIALALLSTVFLLSRVIETEIAIPFAEKEVHDRLRDQQVTGPIYHGTTLDGDEVAFVAERMITPEAGRDKNEAEELHLTLTLSSGTLVEVNAARGSLDIVENRADMRGDVTITTSTGYLVNSDRLIARLSEIDVTSPGPVRATGPLGRLDAGGMTLSSGNGDGAAHLVFTNGVKLIYTP